MPGFTHESSALDVPVEWFTPSSLFDALGLTFDLDPCSPGAGLSFVPARKHLTIEDDGLATPWDPRDLAFVNPPYGRATPLWLDKLAAHGNGIALVFARTSPAWFQRIAPQADALCFISGRVRFYRGNLVDQPGSPGADSMLLAFGQTSARAVHRSGLGVILEPSPGMRLARPLAA